MYCQKRVGLSNKRPEGKITGIDREEEEIHVEFMDGEIVSFHPEEFTGTYNHRYGELWMLD